jgi:hypothetical protein
VVAEHVRSDLGQSGLGALPGDEHEGVSTAGHAANERRITRAGIPDGGFRGNFSIAGIVLRRQQRRRRTAWSPQGKSETACHGRDTAACAQAEYDNLHP